MSVYECSITNPKKQLEFYKVLSEQLQQENKQLKQKVNQLEANRDEAIKYVKSLDYDDYGTGYYDIAENHYDELLSILERGKE